MTGPGHHVFTGTLDKYTGGQGISCAYVAPGQPVGNDGTITITYTASPASGQLTGGRSSADSANTDGLALGPQLRRIER